MPLPDVSKAAATPSVGMSPALARTANHPNAPRATGRIPEMGGTGDGGRFVRGAIAGPMPLEKRDKGCFLEARIRPGKIARCRAADRLLTFGERPRSRLVLTLFNTRAHSIVVENGSACDLVFA
jgi:hypothetical protein